MPKWLSNNVRWILEEYDAFPMEWLLARRLRSLEMVRMFEWRP